MVDSGPSFEIWKGPKGGMRIDWTKKGAVRFIVIDYGYAGYAPAITKRWSNAILLATEGKIDALVDFWDMTGYDSQFRIETQTWGQQHPKNLGKVMLLTRSKLVSMGAAVANLAIGGVLKTFTRKDEFDRESSKLGLPHVTFTAPA